MGSIGQQYGGAYAIFPSGSGGQTFPMRYISSNSMPATYAQEGQDESALLSLLTNATMRNFFYFGHSTANGFATVEDTALKYLLPQYYRFVFIDGCSSTEGDLPGVFGMGYNTSLSGSYFQQTGTRPRTFLGYSRIVFFANGSGGPFRDSYTGQMYTYEVQPEVTEFLGNFEFYWYFYYDVSSAVEAAYENTPTTQSTWANGTYLKILGYASLGVNDYNYQSDWSN